MNTKKLGNILIAEDDSPIAQALQLKLENSGFKVQIAKDGEEAMKLILKNSFDIILLDLMMPKKDGFMLLSELKTKKIKTPTIVLSNLGQEDDIKKAKKLGATDYFVKSNTPLVNIVKEVQKLLNS